GHGIDRVGDAGLVGDDLLRAQGDQRRFFGGQRQRFIHRIGVQRLATAEDRGQRLDGHAHDVVFGLLRGERRPSRLRVKPQQQRTWILGPETIAHDFCPQPPRRAVLGYFFQQIAVRVEEKRKLRRKFVDLQARVERRLYIRDAIGKREGYFLDRGRARLSNVVAGNGDDIPLGNSFSAPSKNVGDDAHCRTHRINVRAARDVLLEDVVLDRAGKFRQAGALFLGHGNIKAQQYRGGRVDGHGGGDFFEGNLI